MPAVGFNVNPPVPVLLLLLVDVAVGDEAVRASAQPFEGQRWPGTIALMAASRLSKIVLALTSAACVGVEKSRAASVRPASVGREVIGDILDNHATEMPSRGRKCFGFRKRRGLQLY